MAISLPVRKLPSEHVPGKAAWRLVTSFEGLSLKSYPDPASPLAKQMALPLDKRVANWAELPGDPWTIGYGHTGDEVHPHQNCSLGQADAWLVEDLNEAADIVRSNITVPLTPGEFDALTSTAFNLGYIPKSLKACLNGGVTDKGVQMAPGSYGSALQQLPRNCRAGGIPLRGLLRRRLAEACVFSELPWEMACADHIVHLELDGAGNPDPYLTTSLEETLQRARQDIPVMRPDVSDTITKPWGELVLTEKDKAPPPAEPSAAVTKEAAPAPATQPAPGPASTASNTGESKPASPVVPAGPTAPPKPPAGPPVSTVSPPKLPEPDPKVIMAPKTVDVRSIPYGEVTPENGAKNMTDSQRGLGMVIVGVGSFIQIITTRLGIGTAFGAIFYDLSRDPVVIALVATTIALVIGWLTRKRGTKVMTNGMVNAKQLLK